MYPSPLGGFKCVVTFEGAFFGVFLLGHTFLFSGDNMSEINQRIRSLRISKRITQQKMAELLGIKTSSYSQMERQGEISCERLKMIAEILETDCLYLIEGEKVKENIIHKNGLDEICGLITDNLKDHFTNRYCFLNKISDSELKQFQIIFCLSKKERSAVYEYAYKIFKKLP